MDQNRIKEVFSDEDFKKRLMELETVEDIKSAINEKGLDFSEEDIVVLQKSISALKSKNDLTLDELDNVAGGLVITGTAVGIAVGVLAGGVGVGAAVGAIFRR